MITIAADVLLLAATTDTSNMMTTWLNRKKLALAMTLLIGTVLLSGCSSGTSESSPSTEVAPEVTDVNGVENSRENVEDAGGSGFASEQKIAAEERAVVKTGSLSLIADEPTEASIKISGLVIGAGGRVDSLVETPETDYIDASASMTVRIPATKLDATLDDIRKFGTVENLSLNTSDVTQQVTDYKVRIGSLEKSVARLQTLLAESETTADLIQIETTLSQRENELESLKSNQKYLTDQVSFSTLEITLTSPNNAETPTPANFWDAVVGGFNALTAALYKTLIVFGYLLPLLIFGGVIAGVTVVLVRRRKKKATNKKAIADEKVYSDSPEVASEK